MIKENYHTHTELCHHASGKIEDYVKMAIECGYESLGMSDHGPLENSGFVRMSLDEFYNDYLEEFKYCKEKYKDKINLYCGLEIEYLRGRLDYYKMLKKDLDYLILGPHYYSPDVENNKTSIYNVNNKETLDIYVNMIEEALSTRLFSILAHPDIMLCGYPRFDNDLENAIRKICEICIKYDVILECNAAGYIKGTKDFGSFIDYMYPNKHFFKIVSEYKELKVILSLDAHNPNQIVREMDKAEELLNSLGIKTITNPFGDIND